jgi:hypothetical protein
MRYLPMKFSAHQIERLEQSFRATLPGALPTPEQEAHQLERVMEEMRHPDEDKRRFYVVEDGGVYSTLDGRQIRTSQQMHAEESYRLLLEDPDTEFIHDEEEEGYFHPEHGDLVVNRYTFNLSLLCGGSKRGMYADPWCGPLYPVEGGGVPTVEDL